MPLTGLSKFKEKVSKIQELLSLRKSINLHLQEIKMDLSRGNEKAIDVFVSGSETKQLGWIPRETTSEVERMGQMEDLKISLTTRKKKFHFILVKLIVSEKFPPLSCNLSACQSHITILGREYAQTILLIPQQMASVLQFKGS